MSPIQKNTEANDGKIYISYKLNDIIQVKPGKLYVLKIFKEYHSLEINLEIDPHLGSTLDDQFTLYSTNGKYRKVLTVKDDEIDGDDIITLKFDGIYKDLRYTLEIDTGTEGYKYNMFEDISYAELIDDSE